MTKSWSWRQKYVMATKSLSWCKKHVKKCVMLSKSVSCRQKFMMSISATYIMTSKSYYRKQEACGLIAPPFKINFLATENWPKIKLRSDQILLIIIHLASGSHIWSLFAQNDMLTKSKSRSIASPITNLASRKSYLVIILPNSYQKLTKSKIR